LKDYRSNKVLKIII